MKIKIENGIPDSLALELVKGGRKMKAEDIYNKALTEYPIKEKLNKKAVGTYDANYPRRKAFVAGAEWMQEKMIEKAAEWLYVYYPTLERSKSFEDAWKHFKQAMQDESK